MFQLFKFLLVVILCGLPAKGGANTHMKFNPGPLYQKIDAIKHQVRTQREADQEIIRQAENMYQQIAQEQRMSGESRTVPAEFAQKVMEAQEREEARSGNCFENHPFKVISDKTFENCNFGSVYMECGNEFVFDEKSTNELINKKSSLIEENVNQALIEFRKEALTQITENKKTIDSCSSKLNNKMNLCKPLYENSLTSQVIEFYVNTCTEESLDQQVTEYRQFMDLEQSAIDDLNNLRNDIAAAIKRNGELSTEVVKAHKFLESRVSDDVKKNRKPGKTINLAQFSECPASVCNAGGLSDFEAQTGFGLSSVSVNLPSVSLPSITLPGEDTCAGDECGGGGESVAKVEAGVAPVAETDLDSDPSVRRRGEDGLMPSRPVTSSGHYPQQPVVVGGAPLPSARIVRPSSPPTFSNNNDNSLSLGSGPASVSGALASGVNEDPLSEEEVHDLKNAQDKLSGNAMGDFDGSGKKTANSSEVPGENNSDGPIVSAMKGLASKLGLDKFFGFSGDTNSRRRQASLSGRARSGKKKKMRLEDIPLKDPRTMLQERLDRYKRNLASQDGIMGPHSKIFHNVCLHYKEFAYQQGLESNKQHCPNR